MKYTTDEIAELLKDKPHQPHYIAAMVRKAVESEREACAKACAEVDLHSGDHLKNSDPRVTCAAAIRRRAS